MSMHVGVTLSTFHLNQSRSGEMTLQNILDNCPEHNDYYSI